MASSSFISGNFGDIKGFLYAWLGKQNKLPSYEVSQQGTKQRIRFKCEVREGKMSQNELEPYLPSKNSSVLTTQTLGTLPAGLDDAISPPALLPYQPGPPSHYLERIHSGRKMLEEQEESDTNAAIHGNWTIENAKGRLHQYLQKNNLPQ
ncbi:unnamed protein product, partial [Adineta steineri]